MYALSDQCVAYRRAPALAGAWRNSGGEVIDWKQQWWPIAYVRDIDPKRPYGFTLLETPIVIWLDKDGVHRAFKDVCPHRLIPLSEGRITADGELECGYHGWRFAGGGTCTAIPQGGDPADPRAAATPYQCTVKQGLVWVKLLPPGPGGQIISEDAIPVIPELEDGTWLSGSEMWRDLPYDWATLCENLLDVGHVPFTHAGSISKRASSGDFSDMRVLEKGPWGFAGIWPTGPRRGGIGPQSTFFLAPVFLKHTIDAYETRGISSMTAAYAVPIAPGRSRVIVRLPFKFKSKVIPLFFKLFPAFLSHLGNNDVLDEDVAFLHRQEAEAVAEGLSRKPIGQVYHMPGASDNYVTQLRNWIAKHGGGGPFGPQDAHWLQRAGPRLPDAQLLDHWASHTKRCAICRAALRRLQAAKAASTVVALLGGLLAILTAAFQAAGLPLASTSIASGPAALSAARLAALGPAAALGWAGLALVALWVRTWCKQVVQRMYEGKEVPVRNTVKGEWVP